MILCIFPFGTYLNVVQASVTVAKALWRPAHECVTKFLATRHQHRAKAWGRKSAPTREGTYSPAQTNPGERRNQDWCFPRKDMTKIGEARSIDLFQALLQRTWTPMQAATSGGQLSRQTVLLDFCPVDESEPIT